MEAWMATAAVSVAALACVVHYFFFFFSDPIGFAHWYYPQGKVGFKRAVYTATVALGLVFYVYAALMQVFSWVTVVPLKYGGWSIDEGLIVSAATIAVVFLMQAMGEMAKDVRRITRERDEADQRVRRMSKQ